MGVVSMERTDYEVLVIGGGAAGCAVSASLLARNPHLRLAIIEPSDTHYYQPAWTLVGGGTFKRQNTAKPMARVLPRGAKWLRTTAATIQPEHNTVVMADGAAITYGVLVVCPGLRLNWDGVEGLRSTLGQNGVTSNYHFEHCPTTWELVKGLTRGTAIFTQPPMPIKCAGAPQKALYLSCNHWEKKDVLYNINVEFYNAGAALFGVKDFVPPLMEYIQRYKAKLCFNSTLKAVDGPGRRAVFEQKKEDGSVERVEKQFDFLHAVPPQVPPDLVKDSPLAGAGGWLEVDHETLCHPRYPNVFGLGDVIIAPNAKTAAAVRKQAPVVAANVLNVLKGQEPEWGYDGYGACPLTVERGKVVLAEFGYGGKLLPTFPMDPTVPRRSAWLLKQHVLPVVYWDVMLRGREWLVKPKPRAAKADIAKAA